MEMPRVGKYLQTLMPKAMWNRKARSSRGHRMEIPSIGQHLQTQIPRVVWHSTRLLTVALALSGALIMLNVDRPFLMIAGDSMLPTLDLGDLVLIENPMPSELKRGDVIAFYPPVEAGNDVIIHRIVSITYGPDGRPVIQTRGDNVPQEDPFTLSRDDIKGRVIAKVPRVGLVTSILSNPFYIMLIAAVLLVAFWKQRERRRQRASGIRTH